MREDPTDSAAEGFTAGTGSEPLTAAVGERVSFATDGTPAAGFLRRNRGLAIWLVLLVEALVWTVSAPEFLSVRNITDILRQGSLQGIVAVGGTFVLLTGEIDLTVGSLTGFAGIVAAGIMTRVDNTALGITIAIGIGLLSGLAVGLMTTRARVPSFIVTLAGLEILAALTLLFANGATIPITNAAFQWFGIGYIGPVPIPVYVMIGVYVVGWLLLTQTTFGRRTYAVGGNRAAAQYSGINIQRHIVSVFALAGVITGIGAILIAGRLASASPLTGQGLELQVIAAIVVGGTSLFGGSGSLLGTLAGVLIIAVLQNGLTLINISSFWQQFAIGVVILVAVTVDRALKRA